MGDIGALLHGIRPHVTATTVRQWSRISVAMVAMTGRVTMRGIARWAGTGGRYRPSQRFFSTVIPWGILFGACCRRHVHCPGDSYLVAGAAGIVTKAGKCTPGLDRFLARLYGKPVPGLAFCTRSLVRVQARRSFPRRVEQGVRTDEEKAASQAQAAAKQPQAPGTKRRPGRPQGSPNRPQAPVTLTPELGRLTALLTTVLHLSATGLSVTSLGLAGPFGNHNALHRARQCGLHRMSKLRCDAALSFPSVGPYAGRGPRRPYGDQVEDDNLLEQYGAENNVEGHIKTQMYQMQRLHKELAQPLPVVISVKTNLRPQARAHVGLCSSALALA